MEAIARISFFNNLFYVCAGIAAISLILTVFFFIRFDIPSVYAVVTGKRRKRSVQRMQAQSSAGKAMHSRMPRKGTGALEGKTGHTGAAPQRQEPEQMPEPSRPEPRPETGVLKVETPETQVLQAEPVRQEPKAPITEELPPTEYLGGKQPFTFRITENTISVHTDEWI